MSEVAFEVARDKANPNEPLHPAWDGNERIMWNAGADWGREYMLKEVNHLKDIIARAPNENDDLGAEYTHVCILKERFDVKIKALEEAKRALEFYAERAVFENTCKFEGDDGKVDVSFIATDALKQIEELEDGI